MKAFVLLCLLLIGALTQKQLSLPIDPQTQKKLSIALKTLGEELATFRTPAENPNSLYTKVSDAALCIQDVRRQLGQTSNVVVGQGNYVKGSRNILVGNYDSIRGSNNFVFVDGFDGSVNGALLIQKWKIILNKKQSIRTNPNSAIFLINQEENRKYQRYLTKNRAFNYGSNLNKNKVLLIQDDADEMAKQIAASLAALPRPQLANLFGSSTTINSPQNGVQYFGSSNIISQPQQYDKISGIMSTASSQSMNYPAQQYDSSAQRSNIPTISSQKDNSQSQKYDTSTIRTPRTIDFASGQTVNLQPQGIPNYPQVDSQPIQNSNKYVSTFSTTVPMSNIDQTSRNSMPSRQNSPTKTNILIQNVASNQNSARPSSSFTSSTNGQQKNIINSPQKTVNFPQQTVNFPQQMVSIQRVTSNMRQEEMAGREMFNVLNAQMRSNLNSRYVRVPEVYQSQSQQVYIQPYPSVENYVYQQMSGLYSQLRGNR